MASQRRKPSNGRVPPSAAAAIARAARADKETLTVPRSLVADTLALLLRIPAQESYLLLRRWDEATAGILQPAPAPE